MFGNMLNKAKGAATGALSAAQGAVTGSKTVEVITKVLPTEQVNAFATSCKGLLPEAPTSKDVLDSLPQMHRTMRSWQDSSPIIGGGISAASTMVRAKIQADPVRGSLMSVAETHGSSTFGDFLNELQEDDLIMLIVMLLILFVVPNPLSDLLDTIGLIGDIFSVLEFLGA